MNHLPKSSCSTGKHQYINASMAKAELEKIHKSSHSDKKPIRHYKCDYCDYIHLTSKTVEEFKINLGQYSHDEYLRVKFDRYLSSLDYVSNSMLKKLDKSPAHLKAYLDDKESLLPSDALIIGRAAHAKILEPDYFDDEYFVIPDDLKKITKPQQNSIDKGKPTDLAKELSDKWGDIYTKANGRELIRQSSLENIELMRAELMKNSKIKALLSIGSAEMSRFFIDESTGVKCKMRADFVHGSNQSVIVDYKTCDDARPQAFAKSIVNYGYDIQAAHYKIGGKADYFYIVAQEKNPPFACVLYLISSDWIKRGELLRRAYLDVYAECLSSDKYPSYPANTNTLEIPRWAQIGE